jgi:hypothetical protein
VTGSPEIEETLGGLRQTARRIHDEQAARLGRREKPRRPAPDAPDIDKAIALAVEMRGLISAAHAASKDIRSALAEYRQLLADADKTVDAAMGRAANLALQQWTNHLQAEQNRHAARLNESVTAARDHILKCLTVSELKFSREVDNLVHFKFEGPGAAFDADYPLPHPEAGLPEGKI